MTELFDMVVAAADKAKERCRAAGMDPDFVGTKGYPNWKDFTAEASAQTAEFLEATAAIVVASAVKATAPVAAAPPKHFHSVLVRVPVGHKMPGGHKTTHPFNLTVQYGARWHPEWPEPRIVVAAYRFMPAGDAIGFTGKRAGVWPLPAEAAALASRHGETILFNDVFTKDHGLTVPTQPEKISDFIVRPALAALN